MITITRKEFKEGFTDPDKAGLWEELNFIIKTSHTPAPLTIKLLERSPSNIVVDMFFATATLNGGELYISYKVSSWLHPKDSSLVVMRMDEITLYDSFIEYQAIRTRMLNSVPANKQEGANFN